MGANPTQAQGVVLFLVAFTLIAAGFAADISIVTVLVGLVLMGISIMRFLKCKPWEHNEE
jgi:uncharacterized membrane protein